MEWNEFDIDIAEDILGDITSSLPKDRRHLNASGQNLEEKEQALEVAVDMYHRFVELDIDFLSE